MSLKSILLEAPTNQIDPVVLDVIRKWDEPETAAQVLEALDCATNCGGASEFAMGVLNLLLQTAIETEETTYEAVVKDATWRANFD